MIIDAHVHLWKKQQGEVAEGSVYGLYGGKSNFAGTVRQMMPPYLLNGENTVEYLISNMDYAQVNAAVITQEYMDGNQDAYLQEVKKKYPDRIKICSLYEERDDFKTDGFDGIKICGARMKAPFETSLPVFKMAQKEGKFVAIDLAEGTRQVGALREIIEECPDVRIALGHFGMVGREGWEAQIALAKYPNVYIESGGITWLFHREYYPYPSAVEAIVKAKEICGMEKLMWGSDYPRTMTAITYQMSRDFICKSDKLSENDKRLFLGGNAEKFYGFIHQEELPKIPNMVED
ncbi:MAG: amidohydrolase [Clostridiales bacterium]|nr:amidohydrolase [Clostridiales bacterium]